MVLPCGRVAGTGTAEDCGRLFCLSLFCEDGAGRGWADGCGSVSGLLSPGEGFWAGIECPNGGVYPRMGNAADRNVGRKPIDQPAISARRSGPIRCGWSPPVYVVLYTDRSVHMDNVDVGTVAFVFVSGERGGERAQS